jgi:hypothetical protein
MKATRASVRTWLLTLMARQAPQSEHDVKAAVALSLPSLQLKFPAEAFCQASIDHIAATERFWNEAGVTKALDAWWRQNDTTPVRSLPPEAEAALVSQAAKYWLAGFYNATDDTQAARQLDLIRGHSPEAYEYITRNDPRAASIAVWHKWWVPRTSAELAADWDDEQAIRQKVRALCQIERSAGFMPLIWSAAMKSLIQAVRLHAPHHKDALVDELMSFRDGRAAQRSAPAVVTHGMFDSSNNGD